MRQLYISPIPEQTMFYRLPALFLSSSSSSSPLSLYLASSRKTRRHSSFSSSSSVVFIAMEISRCLILAGFFFGLVCRSSAYDFYVGGRDGWVLKPAENYNLWAEKMRFQINDKLVFKYKKGEDSVLLVKKEDYNSCNTSNTIKKFDDGDSVFVFDRSGPFFFISGAAGHCAQGEKLLVVVMSGRNKPVYPPSLSPPSSSPSPAPLAKPPSPSISPSAIPPSSNSTSAPAPSSAQVNVAAKLSFGLLALFFVAAVLG